MAHNKHIIMTGYWYQRITQDAFENAASRFARNYAIELMLHNLRFRLLAELDQRSIDQLLYVHTVQLLTGHCIHTVHCTAQFSYTWISCLQKKLCSNQLWTTLFHRPFRNPMWLKEKHRFVRCWVNALRCSICICWLSYLLSPRIGTQSLIYMTETMSLTYDWQGLRPCSMAQLKYRNGLLYFKSVFLFHK